MPNIASLNPDVPYTTLFMEFDRVTEWENATVEPKMIPVSCVPENSGRMFNVYIKYIYLCDFLMDPERHMSS